MVYLLLLAAIVVEVIGAVATRLSDGFTRLVPTLIAVAGVLSAYYLAVAGAAARDGPRGGICLWSAVGITLVALAGVMFLGDSVCPGFKRWGCCW